MRKTTVKKATAAVAAVGLVGALGLSLAAPASAAKGVRVECSQGSALALQLTREGRQLEADVEIYAGPRERWTITVSQNGRVAHTVNKTTNREGELDFWRYLPGRSGTVDVRATSPSGETCSARLRA